MQNRNHLIDLLRFLAATWVVFFHLNEPIPYIDNLYRNFSKLGHLGVPIFFVISGYCILMSALNAKTAGEFLVRRLFRIFPPYWISLLIVLLAAIFQKLYTGNNSIILPQHNIIAIFATISLSTSPISNIPTINWVYWSLSCELAFYLLVFFGLYLPKKYLIYFFIGLTFVSLLVPNPPDGLYFFLHHWPSFSLGLSIYYLHSQQQQTARILIWILLFLSLGAMVQHFGLSDRLQFYYLLVAMVTAVLLWISTKWKLKANFFSTLGDYSYSLYLIHVPIGVYILGKFKTQAIQSNMLMNIGYDLFCISFTICISYGMFRLIELPSINWGKQLANKLPKSKKNRIYATAAKTNQ